MWEPSWRSCGTHVLQSGLVQRGLSKRWGLSLLHGWEPGVGLARGAEGGSSAVVGAKKKKKKKEGM